MTTSSTSRARRILAFLAAFFALATAAIGPAQEPEPAELVYSLVVGTPLWIAYVGDDPRCTGEADQICLSSLVSSNFADARTLAGPDVGPEPEIMYTMGGQRIRLPDMLMVVRRQSDGSLFAVEWDYIFGKGVCLRREWFGQRCWEVE